MIVVTDDDLTSVSPVVLHVLETKAERQSMTAGSNENPGDVPAVRVKDNAAASIRNPPDPTEPEIILAENVTVSPWNESNPVASGLDTDPTMRQPPQARPSASSDRTGGVSLECLVCGDSHLRGIRPGCNLFVSLCGKTVIDLRGQEGVVPPGSHFRVVVVRLCGDVHLYVPRGTQVDMCRISMCGNKNIRNEDAESSSPTSPLSIKLTVVMLCGDIRVLNEEE